MTKYNQEICSTPGCGRIATVPIYARTTKRGFAFKSKPNTLKSLLRAAWWYFRKEKSE